ncbi:MAG: deoxyribodipyrimidine photo-lyase [Bacteroidetes bacterium]|nr:deoxyribodipyrimidine photo-lyase [Bacteroidota bacterium]
MHLFWFRRDLRLDDNAGLYHALKEGQPVLPLFIFDTDILDDLDDKKDRRVDFIHQYLTRLNSALQELGSSLLVKYGKPVDVFRELVNGFPVEKVFTNRDYEPYAKQRDAEVEALLLAKNISFHHFKDHIILEGNEVLKDDGTPYTVFTPYSKRWKTRLQESDLHSFPTEKFSSHFFRTPSFHFPALEEIGFKKTDLIIPPEDAGDNLIRHYAETRDIPGISGTSRLSVHLRFGTVSIRKEMRRARKLSEKFFNELIWREFYSSILQHFPRVITEAFKPEYDRIRWRNNDKEFAAWCEGKTGFPMVDAGMRELNATGYMHNRVRMITASFLTKDLLIDWRWGEAYFAKKLLDFELASNNGGWQWAASSGVDAAPYFRIFNPTEQARRFDPEMKYIRRWIPEFDTLNYPMPIVDHYAARDRALKVYQEGLGRSNP